MPCPCPICQKKGACCNEGSCTQETCQDCEDAGGLWQGFGTECVEGDCPCSTPADHSACEKCEDEAVVGSCPDGRECCEGRCCAEGDFCCDYGCCYCLYPWGWRIIDADGHVYAEGDAPGSQLENLPDPFAPALYWATGTIDFYFQVVGCENDRAAWTTVTNWQQTITLCGTTADRYGWGGYFTNPFSPLGGPSAPAPSGCAEKLRRCLNDCPAEGCDPCPDLSQGSPGTGLERIGGGVAYKFVGTIDGEWTNLNNWEDATGFRPAGSLPGNFNNVVIDADVTTKPTDLGIYIADMTINAGKSFAIEADVADLVCRGSVARPASPVCAGMYGKISCGNAAFDGGTLAGEIIPVNAAVFDGASTVTSAGVVTGSAGFNDTASNYGNVTGTAAFNDLSCNSGTAGTFAPNPPPAC